MQPISVSLPSTGFLRLKQIIGDKKRGIPPIFPIGAATWWNGVKSGKFPQPVKPFGPKCTCWKVEDILALIASSDALKAEAVS
jgi:predicted DNA-binding transcriptional regulator AlpA